MSQHNDFSPSDPNSSSSPGFANFQTQPGGFTSLLAGNTNTQPQPHQQAMSEWQQFQFWQWQQQQQSQTQSFHQPQTQSFQQPQTQSFQQPQTQSFQPSQSFQPQQAEPSGSRKRKDKGKKKAKVVEDATPSSKVQWSQAQERRLAENWIHVSECRKKGNSQDGLTFWFRVMAIFNEGLVELFTKNALSSKWRAMSVNLRSFIACHNRAERDRSSGEDDKVVYRTALTMYEAEIGRPFRDHAAWEVLHNSPKFLNPKAIDEPIDLDDDAEPDLYGHDEIQRPLGKPRASKSARSSSSSDVTSKRDEFNDDVVKELRELRIAKTMEIKYRLRFRKMEFLRMPTNDMTPEDRAEVERQKAEIRAELAAERDE